MAKMTSEEIADMFDVQEDIHGEDKSTEFLLSMTANACDCGVDTVVAALHKHRRVEG